jgi:hypothetical protein
VRDNEVGEEKWKTFNNCYIHSGNGIWLAQGSIYAYNKIIYFQTLRRMWEEEGSEVEVVEGGIQLSNRIRYSEQSIISFLQRFRTNFELAKRKDENKKEKIF